MKQLHHHRLTLLQSEIAWSIQLLCEGRSQNKIYLFTFTVELSFLLRLSKLKRVPKLQKGRVLSVQFTLTCLSSVFIFFKLSCLVIMNLFGHLDTSSPSQIQKKYRLTMATNESVEVISSLALEVKYSEEITIFMLTFGYVLTAVVLTTAVCKRRLFQVYKDSKKLGVTVMLTFCRAVTQMSEQRLLQILSVESKRLPSLNFFIPLSTEESYLAS